MPTINVSALRALPPEQLNRGSGTINFIRLMGGAVGVNGFVVFIEQRAEFHSVALAATQTPSNVVSRELLERIGSLLGNVGVPEAARAPGALHYLGRVIEAQANTLGFQDGFMLITGIFLGALIPAWVLGLFGKGRRR